MHFSGKYHSACLSSLMQQNSILSQQNEELRSSNAYMQGLLHQLIANQERIIGKLTLLDANKVVYASPPKRFPTNFQQKKVQQKSRVSLFQTDALDNVLTSSTDTIKSPVASSTFCANDLPIVGDVEDCNELGKDQLSFAEIQKISYMSQSIKNFAKNLAMQMFTEEERATSNCIGTKGKKQLNVEKLQKIRDYIFQIHTMSSQQQEEQWRKCRDAINELGRRKKK